MTLGGRARRLVLSGLTSFAIGCGGAGTTRPAPSSAAIADCPSASALPLHTEVAPPRASASVPVLSIEPIPSTPITAWPARVEVEIDPAKPPCSLVFTAARGEDEAITWAFFDVARISVEESKTCKKGTIFDVATEPKPWPGAEPTALAIVRLAKPGHMLDAQVNARDELPDALIDANFDGTLDLRCLWMTGMYTQSYRFWLFDARSRAFVPDAALAGLMTPTFNPRTKTIADGGRVSGPIYQDRTHGWINGKLETLTSVTTILGETPDGAPLPDGYSSWTTRYERVGGVLKKIFDGPTGSP
jgi:hypothetical protein